MDDPYPAVVALLSGAAVCFFSLTESALYHYSLPRLLEIARKRKREVATERFIESDEQILLSCRTLALLAQVVFVLAVWFWVAGGSGDAFKTLEAGAVAAGVLLTLGRGLPIFLGRLFAERILTVFRPLLTSIHLVASPLTAILRGIEILTARLVGRPDAESGHDLIEKNILSAVEEGEMEGLIHGEEADIIERALDFRDQDVADVMTPRTRMFSMKDDTPVADAVVEITKAGHSRVPVHRKNVDDVIGVLYAKDLLPYWGSDETPKLTIGRLARKPFFVPETKKISQLLDEFKRTKRHIAIVLDEYGGTAGIITIEDIIEEIVGEIEDEFDEVHDQPLLERIGEAEIEVDAQVHVDDLADALDVEIDSDDFDTVGGLVFTVLGRIPSAGDEFDYEGMHVTVLDANERSVNRVKVVRT